MRFTVWVVGRSEPLPTTHPNHDHHRRLLAVHERLGRRHLLAFCGGCRWFLRWPAKETDQVRRAAHAHMTSCHFDALVAGRACLDPDLVDGGESYLRERLMCVHPPVSIR